MRTNKEINNEYGTLIEQAKERGVTDTDAYAVAVMRLRRGLESRWENDGFFPVVVDGKLVKAPKINFNKPEKEIWEEAIKELKKERGVK